MAVLGGGTVGCETAELLVNRGNKITIVEMTAQLAAGLEGANKMDLLEVIQNTGIKVLLNSKVARIEPDLAVTYEREGKTETESSDLLVLAFGQKSQGEGLSKALEDAGIEYRVIGGAATPSDFQNATRTAYFALVTGVFYLLPWVWG